MPAAVSHALSAPAVAALPPPTVSPTAPPADATPPLVPLYAYLAQVPDQRGRRGRRYPLLAMLAQILCGAPHLQAIGDGGADQDPEFRTRLGYPRDRAPCRSTWHYCLEKVHCAALEAQILAWVAAVEAQLQERDPLRTETALAVDGKDLRGAKKTGEEVTPMVTAWGHRLGLTAGAAEVDDGHEIAAVQALLAQVVVEGKVVTLDALHTQRQTAQQLGDAGGDYLMTVKGNQPKLLAAVEDCFAAHRAPAQDRASAEEADTGHGRSEHRWLLAVSLSADSAPALQEWPHARQVFVVRRRVWRPKKQDWREEVAFGITSLDREQAGPAELLRRNRGHWQIENRSHWVRDVTFREDAGLVRTGKSAQTLALCRTVVLSRLRLEGITNIARELQRLAAKPLESLRLLGIPDN